MINVELTDLEMNLLAVIFSYGVVSMFNDNSKIISEAKNLAIEGVAACCFENDLDEHSLREQLDSLRQKVVESII